MKFYFRTIVMTINVKKVIEVGAHIGTLKNEAHPKTSAYWLWISNGLVVIDPEKLVDQLKIAKEKVQKYKKEKKNILIVSEKKMYADEIAEFSSKEGIHYLNGKVPSGFLSNFSTLMKRIASLNEMKKYLDSEAFELLTKKEQAIYKRKYKKINDVYAGVTHLSAKPDLVIVVDGMVMKWFVKELTQQKNIESIVIAGTNYNNYVSNNDIITNMLSYKALDFILKYLLSS